MLRLVLFLIAANVTLAKFHNVHCTNFDDEHGVFDVCAIKAISRTKNVLNMAYTFKKLMSQFDVQVEFFKRANGWHPFLYNITVNGCEYVTKSNNIALNIFYSILKPHLNMELKCPFKPGVQVKVSKLDFDLDAFRSKLPIESGEYLAKATFLVHKVPIGSVDISVIYSNYKELH